MKLENATRIENNFLLCDVFWWFVVVYWAEVVGATLSEDFL